MSSSREAKAVAATDLAAGDTAKEEEEDEDEEIMTITQTETTERRITVGEEGKTDITVEGVGW